MLMLMIPGALREWSLVNYSLFTVHPFIFFKQFFQFLFNIKLSIMFASHEKLHNLSGRDATALVQQLLDALFHGCGTFFSVHGHFFITAHMNIKTQIHDFPDLGLLKQEQKTCESLLLSVRHELLMPGNKTWRAALY
jgi:hypothetical protein